MDLEARSLQPSAKAVCLSKLREYKSDLNQLKKEFKRVSSPDANQSTREELLESGLADVHAVNPFFFFSNLHHLGVRVLSVLALHHCLRCKLC